jgi:hypothetical protein
MLCSIKGFFLLRSLPDRKAASEGAIAQCFAVFKVFFLLILGNFHRTIN